MYRPLLLHYYCSLFRLEKHVIFLKQIQAYSQVKHLVKYCDHNLILIETVEPLVGIIFMTKFGFWCRNCWRPWICLTQCQMIFVDRRFYMMKMNRVQHVGMALLLAGKSIILIQNGPLLIDMFIYSLSQSQNL